MTLHEFVKLMDDGLAFLHSLGGPVPAPTDISRRFLLAVALQESEIKARYQNSPGITPGPARGFWQFEREGGVAGVLNHRASSELAAKLCSACWVRHESGAVWRALEGHDRLATGFARLLLWTDPPPLPVTEADAWDCYNRRLWRPGKPHPSKWPLNWAAASNAIGS